MAKHAFYFSHDTGARNDPKLQKVLMKLGHVGKSVFWDIVEMLHEEGGYLNLSECDNYAFALRTDTDCINSLINDFSLFENDGVKFWSESALRRIKEREAKSKKAAESALSRWKNANASKNDANALSEKCEGNAIKERKGKEIKETTVVLPHSGVFKINWDEWIQFRKEIKKPLTTSSINKQLVFLGAKPEAEAIAILNNSIKNQWQGLFELKANEKQTHPEPLSISTEEALRRQNKQAAKYQ